MDAAMVVDRGVDVVMVLAIAASFVAVLTGLLLIAAQRAGIGRRANLNFWLAGSVALWVAWVVLR